MYSSIFLIRDNFNEFKKLNVDKIFGLSTQNNEYQKEMVKRLNLPYQAPSVEKLEFANQLKLSIFEVENMKLIKRITLVLNNN